MTGDRSVRLSFKIHGEDARIIVKTMPNQDESNSKQKSLPLDDSTIISTATLEASPQKPLLNLQQKLDQVAGKFTLAQLKILLRQEIRDSRSI